MREQREDVMGHVRQTIREHIVFSTVDQRAVAELADRAGCRVRHIDICVRRIDISRPGEPLQRPSIDGGPRQARANTRKGSWS